MMAIDCSLGLPFRGIPKIRIIKEVIWMSLLVMALVKTRAIGFTHVAIVVGLYTRATLDELGDLLIEWKIAPVLVVIEADPANGVATISTTVDVGKIDMIEWHVGMSNWIRRIEHSRTKK
jgi:hypothetical protein